MSLGVVVSEVWSTPRMEAKFGFYPMWRCYAYIKVLDVLHDILYTINPVWCRPITVHECKKVKILTGCTTCNRRYAENILRHFRAWKPSHTSIIILVSEGTGWAQKQQEFLACSWKHRPMVRQDVPAGATFPAYTQALTIYPRKRANPTTTPRCPKSRTIQFITTSSPMEHAGHGYEWKAHFEWCR